IDILGKHKGVRSLAIYGGTGYGDQIHGLKSGVQVVVGTPGRVVDHINKGTLQLDGLQTLVLDEADEMISMGFKEDLETVLQAAPKDQANIWLFSATMSPEVRGVADAYLTEPQKVQVNRTEMLPSTVEQVYFMVHEYDKPQLVTTLIDAADDFYGIIFCQTKSLVADLTQFLKDKGYTADALHGDIDQTGRDRVMKNFRDRKVTVLVATDVACRGLDVKDITHVVNYSIPRELDNYVHRIGRTGRSGKSGKAFSLVTRSHRELIGRIERMTKSRMTEGTIPSLKDIAIKKLVKAKEKFVTAGPQGRLTDLLGATWADVIDTLTKEEITARFLAMLNPELAPAKASDKEEVQVRAPAEPGRGGGGARYADRGGDRGGDRGAPRAGGYQGRPSPARGGERNDRGSYAPRDAGAPRYAGPRAAAGEGRPSYARAAGPKPPWKKNEEARFEGAAPRAPYGDAPPAKARWKKDFKAAAPKEGGAPSADGVKKAAFKKPYGKKFAKGEGEGAAPQGGMSKFKKAARWGDASATKH
ncbi:MAG: DEAD/DEAH box helicase, partial [Proteobacteria bacterium]